MESIPSRNETQRPTIYFNEGGEKCFDNNSVWMKLLRYSQNKTLVPEIHDIFEFGGTTPKNILSFNDNEKVIWKPQINKTSSSKHFDSSFNEVIYFHLDCLLEVRRTPPAVSYHLPYTQLLNSLSSHSRQLYDERDVRWDIWRRDEQVPGVAQEYVKGVHHVNVFVEYALSFIRKMKQWLTGNKQIFGETDVTMREYAQRDMLDFIVGNWDRAHNQFYVRDEGISKLVYLDHNHLKLSAVYRTFKLTNCKFWFDSINRLRMLHNTGVHLLLMKSLQREPLFEYATYGQFFNPIRLADQRTDVFLQHVDNCIDKYGFESVFGFSPKPQR